MKSKFNVPWLLLVGAAYFGSAKLGLSWASLHANVSPVWPPTGLAIAAVWYLGNRIWPAIAVAAFFATLLTGAPVLTAAGIATGNTLEAVTAALLLLRFVGGHNPLYRARDVIVFVILAGGFSTTLSASIGNLSLCLGGASPWSNFGTLWLTWWL